MKKQKLVFLLTKKHTHLNIYQKYIQYIRSIFKECKHPHKESIDTLIIPFIFFQVPLFYSPHIVPGGLQGLPVLLFILELLPFFQAFTKAPEVPSLLHPFPLFPCSFQSQLWLSVFFLLVLYLFFFFFFTMSLRSSLLFWAHSGKAFPHSRFLTGS